MDLAQLQRAIAQNAMATQKLKGLDESYGRAEALRGSQPAQIDQYGQVSPLAVMAGVLDQERGRRDMRGLEPQRELARRQIGEGESAVQGNTLKMALDKIA